MPAAHNKLLESFGGSNLEDFGSKIDEKFLGNKTRIF